MNIKNTSLLVIYFVFIACNGQLKTRVIEEEGNTLFADSDVIIHTDLGIRIDSLLRKEFESGFSGSVLVAREDSVILKSGYGFTDSTKSVAITPGTKFYLASTTKGITGTVALCLVQQNNFSVNDSLNKFFLNTHPEFSNITVHDMLIHQSGLSNEYETYGYATLEDNVSLIFSLPPVENPDFMYTGAGYWMTAAVIEKVTQKPYEQYVHETLFKPANMNNTSFWFEIDENDNKNVAQKLSEFPPNGIAPNWGFRASSGILSDISDFYNYFRAITNGHLLNEKNFKQLIGPHITLKSGIGIGYGWYTSTTKRGTTEIWSRGGEVFGHNSAIRWFKDENVLICILTNSGQLGNETHEANRTVSDKIENLIFENVHNKK